MKDKAGFVTVMIVLVTSTLYAQAGWDRWPPREYLVKSLVEAVPEYLKTFHGETGRFGTEPWICSDQNVIFPLAVAWSLEDPNNPWFMMQRCSRRRPGRRSADRRHGPEGHVDLPQEGQLDLGPDPHAVDLQPLDTRLRPRARCPARRHARALGTGAPLGFHRHSQVCRRRCA